jgi:multisubunit Na+/H+ antiporter MnhE subunit
MKKKIPLFAILLYLLLGVIGMYWDVILGFTRIESLTWVMVNGRLQYFIGEFTIGIILGLIVTLFNMPPVQRNTDILFRAMGASVIWILIFWYLISRTNIFRRS